MIGFAVHDGVERSWSDRLADHDERRATRLDATLEGETDRDDHERRRRWHGTECDARRAGAHPVEAAPITGRAFREDRHHGAAGQLLVTRLEHGAVVTRPIAVGPAIHGQHAGEGEERAGDDHLPQRRLGEEPGEAAEHRGHHDRIDEPVAVVGDHEHGPISRDALAACHLDGSIEGLRECLGEEAEHAISGAAPQPWRSLWRRRGHGVVEPSEQEQCGEQVPEAVGLEQRLLVAQRAVTRSLPTSWPQPGRPAR